jgi:hypothetical protein
MRNPVDQVDEDDDLSTVIIEEVQVGTLAEPPADPMETEVVSDSSNSEAIALV